MHVRRQQVAPKGCKFPITALLDTSPGGVAERIAKVIFACNENTGKEVVEVLQDDQNVVRLVKKMFEEVEADKICKAPVIYVSKVVDSREDVMDMAESCGAKVVEDVRQCTHHIIPDVTQDLPSSEKEVCEVMRDDAVARIHWTFYPSSYDLIRELEEGDAVAEKYTKQKEGAFLVPVRWLLDSHKHKEWMLEQDYREDSMKRKLSEEVGEGDADDAQEAMARKRQRQEEPITLEKLANVQDAPVETAVAMADAAEGKGAGEAAVDAVNVPAQEEEEEEELPEMEKKQLRELYVVPGHAAWFDYGKIHEIEKRACPDFFDGRDQSQTPKTYKEFRNYMIDKFREDPRRRITFTNCRKALVGEVSSRLRIFEFLEHWGIINYIPERRLVVGAEGDVLPESAQSGFRLETGAGSELPIEAEEKAAALGEKALYQFPKVNAKSSSEATYTGASLPNGTLIGTKGVFGAPSALEPYVKEEDRAKMVFCNSCGGQCSELWYKCTSKPDYDLCPFCFSEGKLSEGLSSGDFLRMESSGTKDEHGWSKQEVLLLLEGLEMYNENWQDVAEHVGTKSQFECINYFLTMPIEDQFLNQLEFGANKGKEGELEDDEDDIPFADSGNPVMAQVAFLAAMVGPRVAAAAAQAALNTLATEDPLVSNDARKAVQAAVSNAPVEKAQNGSMPMNKSTANPELVEKPADPPSVDSGKTEAPGMPTELKMRAASATALSAAAVKAKLHADQEEKEIQRLMVKVVELQLKKMEAKLKHFEQLEELLAKERDQVEAQRQKLFADRVQLQSSRLATPSRPQVETAAAPASIPPSTAPSKSQAVAPTPVASAKAPTPTSISNATSGSKPSASLTQSSPALTAALPSVSAAPSAAPSASLAIAPGTENKSALQPEEQEGKKGTAVPPSKTQSTSEHATADPAAPPAGSGPTHQQLGTPSNDQN